MVRKVYLDTCCIIYLLENVPEFSLLIHHYLEKNSDVILCVSPLVRLEVLIKPIKEDNPKLVRDYNDFLAAQQWLSINDDILMLFDEKINIYH